MASRKWKAINVVIFNRDLLDMPLKFLFLKLQLLKQLCFKNSLFIFMPLFILLSGCQPFTPSSMIEKVQSRDHLIWGTFNSTLTYSHNGNKFEGIDYELAKQFANYLNVELQINEYKSLTDLLAALDEGKIDFAGAGLNLTKIRAKKYRSSPPYYYTSKKVVYRRGSFRPRSISDLNAPLHVIQASSHKEFLRDLQKNEPNLEFVVTEAADQEDILRLVVDKKIKFAVVDSGTLAQKQRFYPELAEAFPISKKLPVAWLIRKDTDDSLYSLMIDFIGKKHQDHTIEKLEEKYFGHVKHFDYVDTRIFLKRIKTKLPKYEALFKKHANKDVDWILLAAVAYQESHWNPNAVSPTGVRGMMMLTHDTASFVGIKNRRDAEQSIKGGAKYLAMQINRLPNSIPQNQKVWFALASYNIGFGHMMGARKITKIRKQNPNSWTDVKNNLPLLHQRKWFRYTRYGYARGREAQHYVNNIRQYQETLQWYVAQKNKKEEEQRALIKAQELKELEAQEALIKAQKLKEIEQETSREDALLIETEVSTKTE